MYGFLADAMVAAHVGYVAFVVFGQLAIVIGASPKREWARNPWFRGLHLLAVHHRLEDGELVAAVLELGFELVEALKQVL